MDQDDIELLAVGDIQVRRRGDPKEGFALARDVMHQADIMFGNCEAVYCDDVHGRNPSMRGQGARADPHNLDAVKDAGFHVMTFANNHSLDANYGGFFECIDRLKQAGIAVCGAGKDMEEAHAPAIVERGGTRFAFLGYNAINFPGYAAAPRRPGVAALNIYTHYEQVEHEQPGSKPRIRSFCKPEDLARLREDIRRAKEVADIVVFSPHWGIHFTPIQLTEYEVTLAHDAIDFGADIVLGHHQHILKAVEVYKGKPIYYGLGNFIIDCYIGDHPLAPSTANSVAIKEMVSNHGEYGVAYRPETPSYPFHAEARNTMIAKIVVKDKQIKEAAFIPCFHSELGQPEPLSSESDKYHEVVAYVEKITRAVGFPTNFEKRADDCRIS